MIDEAARQLMLANSRIDLESVATAPSLQRFASSIASEKGSIGALKLVAAMTAYEWVGAQVPEHHPGLGRSFCEMDDRPVCPDVAGDIADRIINLDNDRLLVEWLGYIAAGDWIVPYRLLVTFLDKAGANKISFADLQPVIGTRGRWLARQNSAWRTINVRESGELDPVVWEEGTTRDRESFLRLLHKIDSGKAREILSRDLEEEDASARARFIRTLSESLTVDDEDFLESVLDDRSIVVRQTAAQLLGKLPGSRFRQRMQERFRESIRLHKNILGRKALQISPPEELTGAMRRDGMSAKSGSGMGKKAWLLFSICKYTPPSWITTNYDIRPHDWIAMAIRSDWSVPLLSGAVQATVLEENEDWASALLNHKLPKDVHYDVFELVDCLEAPTKIKWLQDRLGSNEFLAVYQALLNDENERTLLDRHLSETLLKGIQKFLESSYVAHEWSIRNSLPKLAACVSRESLPFAESCLSRNSKNWSKVEEQAEEFHQIIAIRKHMREVFRNE